MKKIQEKSRREFITTSAAAVAGFTILPGSIVSGLGHKAPSDKLNIAGIGIGGMGKNNLTAVAKTENITALCDVDWSDRTAPVFNLYPSAKKYKDYRLMFDKEKDIDAVIIATPDHTHAVISVEAMRRGKHCFTQKPLTYTVKEARVLAQVAHETGVATQMGNQGQASDSSRRLIEEIASGAIGQIHEVHVWTDRPIWPQGIPKPADTPAVPSSLDWDLFIGPAPMRAYHPAYHPFKWRGWWDFGTGALGDIGCHSFDTIFRALKLKYPVSIQAVSSVVNTDSFPLASIVRYEFPAREGMPPLSLIWYDGGLRPMVIPELEPGMKMGTGGTMYVGEKGKIFGDKILPMSLRESYKAPTPYLPSSPGHEEEWIEACKGRKPAGSNFQWAGPLTETVLLGNIALRQELRLKLSSEPLIYDAEKFCFPTVPEADQYLHREYREGWKL